MISKTLIAFFLSMMMFQACSQADKEYDPMTEKARLDSLIMLHLDDMLLIGQKDTTPNFVSFSADEIPEDLATMYNIYKDSTGRISYIAEIPVSQSGDWMAGFLHYFDPAGRTFAYEEFTNYFGGECSDINYRTISKYYDTDFQLIKSDFSFAGEDGEELDPDSCDRFDDWHYIPLPTLDEYLAAHPFNDLIK